MSNSRCLSAHRRTLPHSTAFVRSLSTSRSSGSKKRDSRSLERSRTPTEQARANEKPRLQQSQKFSLGQVHDEMASLRNRQAELDSITATDEERLAVFSSTQNFVKELASAVKKGKLNPGRQGRALGHLTKLALAIYSQTPPDGDSVYQACLDILNLLKDWNLERQSLHYAYVIQVAASHEKWKEASQYFLEQIDPDLSGLTPMQNPKHNALGLYAIARHAQEQGGAVADQVMDAVLLMSTVGHTNQDKYVLTAGIALGRAGEWESFMSYLKNSYNSARLGQPLVASVMRACILCSRPDEALELFDELILAPVQKLNEWHSGGEYIALNALSRDLAMRALGEMPNDASERALELYQQVKEGELQISAEALSGIMKACERDEKWREAVEVFEDFLDHHSDPHWLVDGDTDSLTTVEEATTEKDDAVSSEKVMRTSLAPIGDVLSSVMRSCNSSGNFGMALVCAVVLDASIPASLSFHQRPIYERGSDALVHTLVPILLRFENHQEVLVAAMTALCGLGCSRHAQQLYNAAEAMLDDAQDLADARLCFEYAKTLHVPSGIFPSTWESAHMHIHRLACACAMIQSNKQKLSNDQRNTLFAALAKAMKSCTAAGQAEAGLFVAKRLQSVLVDGEQSSSLGGTLASFLGFQDSQGDGDAAMHSDTMLLAETMSAYRQVGGQDQALELLTLLPESFDSNTTTDKSSKEMDKWTPVVNEAIHLLADEGRMDVANELYRRMDSRARNQDTLVAMAKAFETNEQWNEIIKLYQRGLDSGLLTDSLVLLALKAVVESTDESTIQQLRFITREAGGHSGMSEKEWLASHYWTIERLLNEHNARLLMWWNDLATSKDMKLQFAIDQFAMRQKAGLTPKYHVARYIVSRIRDYKKPTELVPFSRDEWLVLLRNVLGELQAADSFLWTMPKFIEEACLAFLWLGAKEECVEFATDAMSRGVRITSATVSMANEAAEEEGLKVDELAMLNHFVVTSEEQG